MALKNEQLQSVFANDSQQTKFFAACFEELLGTERTASIMEQILPAAPAQQARFKGQLASVFLGMDRETLKRVHNFSDAEVTEFYAMMKLHEENAPAPSAEVEAEVQSTGGGTDEATVDATISTPQGVSSFDASTLDESNRSLVEEAAKPGGNTKNANKRK